MSLLLQYASIKSSFCASLFIVLLAASCAPSIDTVETPVETPEAFSLEGSDTLPNKWWTAFQDTVLDTLVEKALQNNLSLAANWQNLQANLATVRAEQSAFWPQIGSFARAGLAEDNSERFNPQNYEVGLLASYEVDLWGRIDAAVEAEQFRAEASFYDYQTAAVTLSAEVSRIYFNLLFTQKQLELAQEQIRTNENIISTIRQRFASGQIRAVDILRQQQLIETTRRQKINYETEIALLKNQLAVLLGQAPQNGFEIPKKNLPEIPAIPKTGIPLDLVRRRPDILQAFNQVLAADREMARAISSQYPRISIDFEAITLSENFSSLFQNWAYSLAGNLTAPLFYGNQIRAEIDRTEAVKNQLLYQYGQVVLNAFQDVENNLIQEVNQKRQIAVLEKQLDLTRKTNKQLQMEFLNGLTDYLDVLLSLAEEQQLQRSLLETELGLLEIRIALYRNLAGGFETEEINSMQE